MIIGVPRERKTLERRVALTPEGATTLIKDGHTVLIETNAGLGASFPDDAYASHGCQIVSTLSEVWKRSELLIKVKEPDASEFELFRPGLKLFCFLHLASLPEVAKALLDKKVTALAYELVTVDNRFPILEPMSEVAGHLAVINGSSLLLAQNGGRGILTTGALGVPPARVLILGAGVAGKAAAETASGMGAAVTILDLDTKRLETVALACRGRIETLFSTPGAIAQLCTESDLLIGAVLVPGAKTPHIVPESAVQSMKKGSVIVDISIDQGGCIETVHPTTLDAPTYEKFGVVHYGVCNMPAQAPLTSTRALTNRTLPFIRKLAANRTWIDDSALKSALNCVNGSLTNKAVSQALNIPYIPTDTALKGIQV